MGRQLDQTGNLDGGVDVANVRDMLVRDWLKRMLNVLRTTSWSPR
jgi:hypothetical protein